MKRLLLLLLALCLPGRPARADEYAGLAAGDVAVPLSCRVFNASGSQCCWCSLETCARYLRLTQLYDLTRDRKHASDAGEMVGVLRARKVQFVEVRSEGGLRAALGYRLPVSVIIPGHCCVLVGLDDGGARVLSNNHREREVQTWPRAQWQRLWQGWGVVLYPPDGRVDEPAPVPQRGGGCYGGVWINVGPRPPPVALTPPACPWCYPQPYAYPPRPGVNLRVNPRPRPRPYHYHEHHHYRGGSLHGGRVGLTALAKATIAACAVEVQQGNAGGSGTFIDYDPEAKAALVASAAHVFEDLGPASVSPRGDGRLPGRLKARVVYLNRTTDVAMLEVPTDTAPVCTALADDEPAPGSKVYKLGYPAYAQGRLNVRTGVVKPPTGSFLFESSCYVQSGDSGGGIFLADGSLCSVITGFYGPWGQLDPGCMFGSGTRALRTAVAKLNANGHNWGRKHRQQRRRRRQHRRHGEVVAALAGFESGACRPSQPQRRPPPRPNDTDTDPGTLPAPRWKQQPPPAAAPPTPPACPCPPPAPFVPPARLTPPEAPPPGPAVPVQTTALGLPLLAVLALKLFLLLHARKQKVS